VAKRYERLSHEKALSMASEGAKVLNGKAAQVALRENVTIVVRLTLEFGRGTLVTSRDPWKSYQDINNNNEYK
jgi:aspartokinase